MSLMSFQMTGHLSVGSTTGPLTFILGALDMRGPHQITSSPRGLAAKGAG